MAFGFRTRCFMVLIAVVALGAMSAPAEARGGRGGRGGAGPRASGGLKSSAPSGGRAMGVPGGRAAGAQHNPPGNQRASGMPHQAGSRRSNSSQQGPRTGPGSLEQKFQQHAGQWQQSAPGHRGDRAQQRASEAGSHLQDRTEPFSPEWYADHPQAWQHTHPHADAAVVATTAGVVGWLGGAYYVESDTEEVVPTVENTTVIYQEVPAEDSALQMATSPETALAETAPAAAADSEWLLLGTYALAPATAAQPTAMLQLSVHRTGQLKGAYYDSITNTTQNVSGTLDRATQTATWGFDNNPQTTFSASLEELLDPASMVAVTTAAGQQEWRFTRVDE